MTIYMWIYGYIQVVREQCEDVPSQECKVVETEVCEQVPR